MSWFTVVNLDTIFVTTPVNNADISVVGTCDALPRRLTVTECANGTPTCSHGRCVQRTGWDEENQPVFEQRCICQPNFYGEACDLLVVSDFAKPVVISPGHINLFAREPPEDTAVTDPVNEKHSYGGAI
ncbi:unnamed protein product [Taenia asiatica]|uniref:EGF-like domain-containing protein n=1 Tax=Taenia asiatica TaxID=60517 RepID=A0A0R3W4I8_TAEAS|nr:unnamed protein product [Taenia asiatica]